MELSELVRIMDGKTYGKSIEGITVTGLCCDSRRAKKGDLFFCKGREFREEYAAEAMDRGCAALVCEERAPFNGNFPTVIVGSISKAMARSAEHFYGYPMKSLRTVAVTGTKGKTTVCGMVNASLNATEGIKSALLSDLTPPDAPRLTTPEALDLHRAAARAVSEGCTHLVCEISSQAQKCGRTDGIAFDLGGFTSFGLDHISDIEHRTEKEYFECKRAIMEACGKAIINISSKRGRELYSYLAGIGKAPLSACSGKADYSVTNVKTERYGCDLMIQRRSDGMTIPLVSQGIGGFLSDNAALAAALALEAGAQPSAVFKAILGYTCGGRGEMLVSADGQLTVVCDYAHNEMSFEACLKSVDISFTGATVSVIFGCVGDKAVCRRAGMARVCAKYADKVTVCEDNSGYEGYEAICKALEKCFEIACREKDSRLSLGAVRYERSRERALFDAVRSGAESGEKSVIFMLGKGSETQNRVCGCDEACIPDTLLAKKAIDEYNKSVQIRTALRHLKGRRTLVCLDGESADGVAGSLAQLRESGVRCFAVCEVEDIVELERRCFENGIAVRRFEGESAVSKREVIGLTRIGILPVFVSDDRKKAAKWLAGFLKADDIVYIESKMGIISGRGITVMSKRRAEIIASQTESKELGYMVDSIKGSVKRVAALDGRAQGALERLLVSGLCDGAVITKRRI